MRKKSLLYRSLRLVLFAVFMLSGVLLVSCGKGGEGNNQGGETPITASDCHIKLGDAGFNYLAEQGEGVTVDTSAVNINAAGSYKIIYKKAGADNVEKTAYVYGLPKLFMDGEAILDSYDLSYKDANTIGIDNSYALKITGKDSFENILTVSTAVKKAYDGKYGKYTAEYSVTDRAGNKTAKEVDFNITGTAPAIDDFSLDLSDSLAYVSVGWDKETDILGVLIDGVAIGWQYYQDTPLGFNISANAFNTDRLDTSKSSYTVTLKTDLGYGEATATVLDNKTPDFSIVNDWIFGAVDSAMFSLPQKNTAQRFTFGYGLECPTGVFEDDFLIVESAVSVSVTTKDGGSLPVGEYTLKIKALRGGAVDATKDCNFTVYTANEFERILAPLTSGQYSGAFACSTSAATFAYDSAIGAYCYNVPQGSNHPANQVQLLPGSAPGMKFSAGVDKYAYYTFDIMYPTNTRADIWSFLAGWNGQSLESTDVVILDGNGKETAYAAIENNKWYTVYMPLYGANASPYFSCSKGGNDVDIKIYMKNFNLSSVLPAHLYNNGIYGIDPARGVTIPEGYTVTLNGQPFAVIGGMIPLALEGVYTAVKPSSSTIVFTVFTAEDYSKIIAPLSSEGDQFIGAFSCSGAASPTFVYDGAMGAYKYTAPGGWGTNTVDLTAGSFPTKQLAAGIAAGYEYFAFDIYYGAGTTEFEFAHMLYGGAASTMSGEMATIYSASGDAVSYSALAAGQWYTVYMEISGASTDNAFFSYAGSGTAYLKNLRFEDLPA